MYCSTLRSLVLIMSIVIASPVGFTDVTSAQSTLKNCSKWNWAARRYCFGRWIDESGATYEGEWGNDRFEGWGTYTFENGDRYVGEFKDGNYHGQGTFTAANGDKYVGEFKDDKFNGQGTYTYRDGRIDVGEFKDGKLNGHGTFTAANGDKYVGEFKDDKFNGQGTLTFTDGTEYVGEFKDDSFDGQGTYTFENGDKYVGEFKYDKFSGQGVYYNSDGSISEQGIYKDGELTQSLETSTPTISSDIRSDGVALVEQGGTYTVPVTINDLLPLNFILDSGASDVSIPADVVLTLIRTGTLKESDFIGSQTYRLADGSTIESKQFTIRSMTVGGRRVTDITGSVADVQGSLLLGQSFLKKFKSWSIDNNQHRLFLE